ncbi:rho GTPase-activating protein 190 isoform X7 [Neocloeon triangulifer]|uniref:rho GTPase-activating protein 190 isoform X7 n=1 Tax=Neocloeon triangulifer TaxID=2078957 RepID=UPI00286F0A52|nr:rho GTPase-activating protein 190 isoform X7 [Neocloeon triangulifer]
MSRNMRSFNISVVGVSGTEKEKGHSGVGKSCLCNRFVRSEADEYNVEHISVLSQMDFSSRVINNDHFLYWGEVLKSSEDGEFLFNVVEQTEFIDDASFQAFKGGKMEPYIKRCCATKLASAEKLMYICKNQLGIEKEYEQKVLPDGRFSVDGFVCALDVSTVPSRSIEKQVEYISGILNNLMKTKKPVVLVTTKNDEANELYVKEAERLVQRKEFKGALLMIETSAHENINVDQAFIALAQLIDRSKGRPKIVPFHEAARMRKEQLDMATEGFQRLIRNQVQDYHCVWSHTSKKLSGHPDFINFVALLGIDSAQRQFRRHVKRLKDEQLSARLNNYMDMLPEILQEMVPDLNTLHDGDWPLVQQHIKDHPDFNQYFFECPEDMSWMELDETQDEGRIPYDVLDTIEAETVFKNHLNVLQQEQKRLELPRRWRKQFKQLLEETGYVTPGKLLSEVRVLFMGRECFEALSEQDCQQIYDLHQKEIIDKAKHNFQELLLEHADLFYHFKSIAPSGTITQDDIKDITDALQEDSRYKALDRLDQDRKLMLFQHLGFVHCPIREHCPAFPNCMDALIERILATKAHRPSSWNRSSQWLLSADSNKLNLVLLGIDGLAEELATEIRAQCEDDEYEFECQTYGLDYRIIDGDVSLPQNSFRTSDFLPHGCFCVYSNPESFEYVRDSLEKTLLSNLEQEDRLPFQGLPIVILFSCDPSVDEKEAMHLREEGQSLADSLQCPFIDVSIDESVSGGDCQRFNSVLISDALRQLVQSIQHRAGFLNIYQSVVEYSEPDIRIILCVFCGDPYSVEHVLSPLLSHQCCFLSGDRSIILETFLGDSKRKVEVIISSFHGANAFREELVHGFVLVYSTKRKASLATLDAFSANIPNLPIQILAVTDSGGANAFFSNDLSHQLIAGGNIVADRLGAHFMTSAATAQQKTAFFTPFFKEVWDKKPEIEQAFNMEEPGQLDDSGEGTLERSSGRHHPRPPPRHESYHIKASNSNDGSGSEIYERLPTDGSMGDELDDQLSPTFPDDQGLSASEDSEYSVELYHQENGEHHLVKPSDIKNRRKLHQGFEVYPPPTTPPEPAPPDHPPQRSRLSKASASLPTGSHSSLEEITSDISGSRESLATRGDSDKEDNELLFNSYGMHAFTTGRRHLTSKSTRPKGNSQTLKQPGKLNMEKFSNLDVALKRMNPEPAKEAKAREAWARRHAPLAKSEDFEQVKDALQGGFQYDGEFSYMPQDTLSGTNKSRLRQRRDKGHRQAYTDSDSDWSSLERRKLAAEMYRGGAGVGGQGRKSTPHKRTRKKRAAIPVATPRVPPFGDAAAAMLSYRFKDDKGKYKLEGTFGPEEESSLDVSSPRDVNSPMGLLTIQDHHQMYQGLQGYGAPPADYGGGSKKDEKTSRKEKQKAKEEEKRRQKEEKKLDKDRKKAAKAAGSKVAVKGPCLADFAQSKQNAVPLIIEKCVQFIESEGVDSEGIYRVPGNRAHVELLFQKLEEDPNVNVAALDIPVNAVATALKDFFSKRLPPIFTEEAMDELENISVDKARRALDSHVRTSDRSMRLLQLRELLTKKLPDENFQVLKFIFQHFVKVAENCKLNSMDTKNLAICWWPTLLPYEFSDMGKFEQMRPHLEDLVQTMIDQFPFLFCGKEAFVMV